VSSEDSYPASVLMVALGFNSPSCTFSSSSRSQSSRQVSLLKSTLTAPDLVPVAIHGELVSGDQAKAAVRGISLRRTIVGDGGIREQEDSRFGYKRGTATTLDHARTTTE
jgi:hypothetical protein